MASITKTLRKLIYSEGVNPLPMRILILLFLIQFFMGMTATMCFSYLPKMVKSFGISEVETGRYAGYIASSVYVGWILCGYGSGYLADLKGHKLMLIVCVSGMIITTLLFGFSSNYYWAICVRFTQGLCLGSVGICKAILTLACDETNVTLAFSIFFTSWTSAFIAGPSLAGYLVFPAEQYPNVFSKESIFARYGVLLPNLVTASCLLIFLILAIIYLPSDKSTRKDDEAGETTKLLPRDRKTTLKDYSSTNGHASQPIREHQSTNGHAFQPMGERQYFCIEGGHKNGGPAMYTIEHKHEPIKVHTKKKYSSKPSKSLLPKALQKSATLFKRKDFMVSVLLYAMSGFAVIGVDEMFPVFAATTKEYNGLALTTSQIGTILLGSSALLFIVQVTITGRISHRYGAKQTYIVGSVLLLVTAPLVPTTYLVQYRTQMTAYAIAVMSVNQILINAIMVNVNVLINNTVTADVYGVANGIAMTGSSVGRAFSPTVFGSIFSWSLTNIKGVEVNQYPLGFPFNQYFSFIVTGVVFFLCAMIAFFCLSSKVNSPRQQDNKPTTVAET